MSVWAESNIVWCDVETNGLTAGFHKLLQIAVIVTDKNLNVLDETGFEAVVEYDEEYVEVLKAAAVPFVREMHEKTGLWDALSGSLALPISQIDANLVKYLKHFGEPRMMPVGGNSVRLDMNFIDEFLPFSSAYLDYHMRDVSTIAGFAEGWYGQPNFEKHNDHTAMTDIRECIREMKHYRDTIFRPVVRANLNLPEIATKLATLGRLGAPLISAENKAMLAEAVEWMFEKAVVSETTPADFIADFENYVTNTCEPDFRDKVYGLIADYVGSAS